MGLETATYITGLTPSWPPSSDFKSQGDDHLRLIKSVLQSTFPSASKALYFPKGEAASVTPMTLDASDQNNFIMLDTTAGNINVTLPAGFAPADSGWSCEISKISLDTNAIMVAAASGNILSQVGASATIRVGALYVPAKFIWTGANWMCVKPGPMVGTTFNFDGASVPYGCSGARWQYVCRRVVCRAKLGARNKCVARQTWAIRGGGRCRRWAAYVVGQWIWCRSDEWRGGRVGVEYARYDEDTRTYSCERVELQ